MKDEASDQLEESTHSQDGIKLNWLTWNPRRPCLLLTFNNLRVLLDCVVGMESLASFLPCPLIRSNRISWQKKVHPYGKGAIPVLKQINDNTYAEIVPEVRTVNPRDVRLESLDFILISNSASLVALPFFTEGTNFRGVVYATEPVVQLSKLIMEDLCETFEQIDRPSGDDWAWKNISSTFSNPPTSDPSNWQSFFTKEEMESCLRRVQLVFFCQEIALNEDLKVVPYSSGHSIGSCNWLLSTNTQKIGYFAASSLRHSHPKPMELIAFQNLDALVLTSFHTIEQSPDITVYKFTSAVVKTLKNGGNVLIPIIATGLIYDLFECLLKAIEVNNLSRNIPVYFISSIAESSLEFANIFSEWLSDDKGARVYKPEEPFYHSEMVRSGRIRIFNSLHGAFSKECRQPCIVFAGHPSLRVGEIVHLLDLWGGNPLNSIMMIDPDYPLETYYSPYKSLAICAYYFPIETRLDCTQVFNKLVNDLSPLQVFYPEEYASAFGTLSALSLQTICLRCNETIFMGKKTRTAASKSCSLTSVSNSNKISTKEFGDDEVVDDHFSWKRVKIDCEVLKQLKMRVDCAGLCPIQGVISYSNGTLELNVTSPTTKSYVRKK